MSKALDDVCAERVRQIQSEGWTLAHDDGHDNEELRMAAACYALGATEIDIEFAYGSPNRGGTLNTIRGHATRGLWPWSREWWKPSKTRRNLVKAAALLIAEIERLDRIEEQRNKISPIVFYYLISWAGTKTRDVFGQTVVVAESELDARDTFAQVRPADDYRIDGVRQLLPGEEMQYYRRDIEYIFHKEKKP